MSALYTRKNALGALGLTALSLIAGCGSGHGGNGGNNDESQQPAYSRVTSVTPNRIPASGGTDITIKGQYFSGRKTVEVDIAGYPATKVVVVDDTTLIATTDSARAEFVNQGLDEKSANILVFTDGVPNYKIGQGAYDQGTVLVTYYNDVSNPAIPPPDTGNTSFLIKEADNSAIAFAPTIKNLSLPAKIAQLELVQPGPSGSTEGDYSGAARLYVVIPGGIPAIGVPVTVGGEGSANLTYFIEFGSPGTYGYYQSDQGTGATPGLNGTVTLVLVSGNEYTFRLSNIRVRYTVPGTGFVGEDYIRVNGTVTVLRKE